MGDADMPVHPGSYDEQKLNDIIKPNPHPDRNPNPDPNPNATNQT